jgi:hypothetical protein
MPARDHRGDRRFQRKRVNRKMPMCRFDSELVVRKRLLIRAGGHVSGNITYGEIEIESGRDISGTIRSEHSKPVSMVLPLSA